VQFLVRLTDRALRDMEASYDFVEADTSESVVAWFNELSEAVYTLGRSPERAPTTPENKKLRHRFFGRKANTYRIIYRVEKREAMVNVLHIRHGARAPFSNE
jgi:plasmid stabilization system protein ParE